MLAIADKGRVLEFYKPPILADLIFEQPHNTAHVQFYFHTSIKSSSSSSSSTVLLALWRNTKFTQTLKHRNEQQKEKCFNVFCLLEPSVKCWLHSLHYKLLYNVSWNNECAPLKMLCCILFENRTKMARKGKNWGDIVLPTQQCLELWYKFMCDIVLFLLVLEMWWISENSA